MIITNDAQTKKSTVYQQLMKSPFQFYLTGSRFFGGATQESDIDLYCENSKEIKSFIRKLGFVRVSEETYTDDPNCAEVYLYKWNTQDEDYYNYEPDIHIQVVEDVDLKTEIQSVISECLDGTYLPKGWTRLIWRIAYRSYAANK